MSGAARMKSAGLWACASLVIGLAAGGGAIVLSWTADAAWSANRLSAWAFLLLPLCALITVWIYRRLKIPFDTGTIAVIAHQRAGERVPLALAPAILAGTALTLLGGGSVGKEAAALQLGGAVASKLGTLRHEFEDAQDVFVMAGMAAAFSALLFTPIASVFFVFEVSRMPVKKMLRPRMLCVPVAAAVAFCLADVFDVGRLWWSPLPAHAGTDLWFETAVLGLGAALVGMAFVMLLKLLHTACCTFMERPWTRLLFGSAVIAALVWLSGGDYSGTGGVQIMAILGGQTVPYEAFVWKATLTVACLGFGFKGGEIMPVLAVGACLGCAFAQMVGADTAFLGAIGMVALFSTCTRCPLSALVLGIEAFGIAGAPWFAVASLLACVFTSRFSLYDGTSWMLDVAWADTKQNAAENIDLIKKH